MNAASDSTAISSDSTTTSTAIYKVNAPDENDGPPPALEGALVPVSPTLLPAGLVIVEARSPEENPALVYLAGLAPGSRRAMGDALREGR